MIDANEAALNRYLNKLDTNEKNFEKCVKQITDGYSKEFESLKKELKALSDEYGFDEEEIFDAFLEDINF